MTTVAGSKEAVTGETNQGTARSLCLPNFSQNESD